jgi:hypothetical protein
MATTLGKRRLSPKAWRALELLASNSRGVTEGFALSHGFTVTMFAGLVRARLATALREVVEAGGLPIKFERYRITAAGLKALDGYRARMPVPPDAR